MTDQATLAHLLARIEHLEARATRAEAQATQLAEYTRLQDQDNRLVAE